MKIEKLIPNPSKPHAPFVRLILDNGEAVEFTVRDAHMKTLTTATKRLAYVLECKEYHAPDGPDGEAKKAARRAAWDADDKARADAAAAAAKAAEEAKFSVTANGIKDGMVGVTIVHHGLTYSGAVAKGADKAEFEQNCRAAFAAYEARVNAEKAELAALAINA